MNGVCSWFELPLSPKTILPLPSSPKHIENEFAAIPLDAKVLGTEIFSTPSPKRPLGAEAPSRSPVCFNPHLKWFCWNGGKKKSEYNTHRTIP